MFRNSLIGGVRVKTQQIYSRTPNLSVSFYSDPKH